ncbi:MAG: MMPL family transporter [Acidimicrobiia bacterium]
MIHAITRFCFRHRILVISIWFFALIVLTTISGLLGPKWLEQGTLKGTESTAALELLRKERPDIAQQASASTGRIVFQSKDNIVNHKQEINQFLNLLVEKKKTTKVVQFQDPFSELAKGQISNDGKIAYTQITFDKKAKLDGLGKSSVSLAKDLRKSIDVEFSGYAFQVVEFPPSEIIGIIAAIFILLVAFGSLVAAGLPIFSALIGIGIGSALVSIWGHITGVPNFTQQVAAMIAIGVGIDYALFIVTRYREAMKRGNNREASVIEAMTTAGAAVLFAGLTVVISLLGMIVININFITGLAIGTSTAVLVMVLGALTLLPALLNTWVGKYIDKLSLPHKKEVPEKPVIWVRWSELIQKRAWFAFFAGVIILVILAIPVTQLRVGTSDDGNLNEKQTAKKAYDILAKGFGPGFNGPLFTVVDLRNAKNAKALFDIIQKTEATPGVAAVFPSSQQLVTQSQQFIEQYKQLSKEKKLIIPIQIVPTTAPQDEDTTKLVHNLRENVFPEAVKDNGAKVYLSGIVPGNIDFADTMSRKVPYFIGAVLILSFILLMSVFRSVLVAIKAVLMNLLSIGASYGVIVAIFQWGWMRQLFGVGAPGPIEPWAPMMLFAIVFGLSMDYEVFLLSKIKEEYDDTKDNAGAVTHGLAATARVITAAAFIMVCVFGSFVIADNRVFKLMGLGLSVAVLLDATIVRMLLVPATMELLRDRNWWIPKWLDKIIPQIHVERVRAHENELANATTEEKATV